MSAPRAARVAAQAKINLMLGVFAGPDASGYHTISTLFQRIDLADDVTVRVGGTARSLQVTGPRVPGGGLGPVEKNLAFRAAVAYAEASDSGFPSGFSIDVTKNIPVGGGLGGGSADAAAVLRILNTLAPTRLVPERMLAVARSLGADVPYLLTEYLRAMGMHHGDLVTPFRLPFGEPAGQADVLLAVPRFGIATADAYRWLDESRPKDWAPESSGALQQVSSAWEGLCMGGNDFEAVVEVRFPLLREIRERLVAKGAAVARLSGSGSTVFGIFEGAVPSIDDLRLDAEIIRTRTSTRVVPVEVLE